MDNLFCLKRNEKSIHFLFYKEFYSWAKNIQKIDIFFKMISDTIFIYDISLWLFSFSKKNRFYSKTENETQHCESQLC